MIQAPPGVPVIELCNVTKRFGPVTAVDGLSIEIGAGETLGMVGESGCGKSTVARLVVGLERPNEGELRYGGKPYPRSNRGMREVRSHLGMVFQDPYESLDPRCTLSQIVGEPLMAAGRWRQGGPKRVRELLDSVGLPGAALDSRPSHYSGGGRQRIGIARALALHPQLVVCDEPTSALDVSIQAQIANLLLRLQEDLGLSYLFISHDLDVVRRVSDRVVVVYGGATMEEGLTEQVSSDPLHPYTKALLAAVPGTAPSDRRLGDRERLAEERLVERDACPFSGRCPQVYEACAVRPPLVDVGGGRKVACHLVTPVTVPVAVRMPGAVAPETETSPP
ncbi:MAG: oligopeptide/dipeptide ABC transporter ATP-binding protein [Acidimicrobiales bacterium]